MKAFRWASIFSIALVVHTSASYLYDMQKTFEQNCAQEVLLEQKSKKTFRDTLFGYPIASRIGVGACAATTSQGIAYAAAHGFDVLTYKTIRCSKHSAYDAPNIYYVQCDKQLFKSEIGNAFYMTNFMPRHTENIAIANSFGNACLGSAWVRTDIAQARASLQEGQILIVSVFGDGATTQEMVTDFLDAACMAYESGAHAIELNLSCPNVIHSFLYKDPELVTKIAQTINAALPQVPLIIKVGVFDSKEQMRAVLKAAAAAGICGIAGINSVPSKIITREGSPAFGQDRTMSGLSGAPIRSLALQFIADAKEIITQEKLPLEILAMGGITDSEHFQEFLDAGATVALSATGFMWNPDLGLAYQHMNAKKEIIQELYKIGAILFGDFIFKSGMHSHLYLDMRTLISAPELMEKVAQQCAWITSNLVYDIVCGVPYGAVPITTAFSLQTKKPMIFKREKPKEYGTGKLIEGIFNSGNKCLVIEDVVTTGGSACRTIDSLREQGLEITDVLVLVDHQQSAQKELQKKGCHVHALFTRSEILQTLLSTGIITDKQYALANESFIQR